MRVCLGGTFEPLHAGHKALLRAAALGANEVFVGIADAGLAKRPRAISPWQTRAAAVEAFLTGEGYKGKLTLRPLTDAHGPAATGDYDRIVVSPETEPAALAINVERLNRGLKPLQVQIVPHMLGDDMLPISGTAVHAGLIDGEGRRLQAIQVAVGSANDVKVAAVRDEFKRLFDAPSEVRGHAVASGVPEQPKDHETLLGARNRAVAARKAWPGCDYAIGIEAGLVRFPGAEGYLEAQACCIIDRAGWETHGWGPAFHYPDWVTARALGGEMVSSILGPVAKDPNLGSTTGAIGWLSDGRLDRVALSRLAILMAFVPRFKRALYVLPEPDAPA